MSMSNHKVTIFKSITDTDTPFFVGVDTVLQRIKDGKSKELINKIRKEPLKDRRNELKKELPAICFSGEFNKRNDQSLLKHSGFICLDFDGYGKKKDLLAEKERLTNDRYVYSVFESPSGDGLKVIVRIPPEPDNHLKYFNSLRKKFDSPHFDTTSKNISRVCYESFDKMIYINENASTWDVIEEPEYRPVERFSSRPTLPISNHTKVSEILLKWWTEKYPMVEGQRNNNAYVLAVAFNEYGIPDSTAEYILAQYASPGFTTNEIHQVVQSAYKDKSKWNTKYFEDQDRIDEIRSRVKTGTSYEKIRVELEQEGVEEAQINSVIERVDEENSKVKFWTKNEKGSVKIVHLMFKQFLEDNGFYKFCPEGGKNYVFVKVTNNLIDHTDEKEIKDFVLDYLLDLEDVSVYNYFADNTRFFKEDFMSLLSTIDVYFINDTKTESYLYYKNCAVRITKNEVETIDYLDLGGYVWKDHVIDRNFTQCEVTDACDYRKFIKNISGHDQDRVKSMESTIGFLMHGHKNLAFCPAVILNDEVISDNPEGGTGKGLFMNALSKMKKVVTIDGKGFNFDRTFAYQLVSADTQILVFDDVKKSFDFEKLFSVITEGLTLEKKNKDAIKIPFHKSPKVAITTNYAIKGAGNSFERRKWELELHQYYKKEYTPRDEFGRYMFSDWNDDDWCEFDNYMLQCLQLYLRKGLIQSKFVNLEIRKLSAETSHDFIEWCGLINGVDKSDKLVYNTQIHMKDCYEDFVDIYPDYSPRSKTGISRKRFNDWLVAYARFLTGKNPVEGRSQRGRWFQINVKE